MDTMSMKIGMLKITPMPTPLPTVEAEGLKYVTAIESSSNPLLDEMATRFNWSAKEKYQQGEQMKDEIELEGWPSEIPPDCPVCKQRLRLDETCAGCGWGTISFLPVSDVNWAEADCGT